MVRDTWREALKDAEGFLDTAEDSRKPGRVRVSNMVHAVIRANDALLLAAGRDKPDDHDRADRALNDALQQLGVFDQYGRYVKNVRDVLGEKTLAEYTGKRYNTEEVNALLKKTRRFYEAVEGLIEELQN